jgi:hypothetical protein
MLQRSQSPAAIRARAYRERRRNGIADYKIRINTKRLVKTLRAAAHSEGRMILRDEDPPRAEIERELTTTVEAFVTRWIGPREESERTNDT